MLPPSSLDSELIESDKLAAAFSSPRSWRDDAAAVVAGVGDASSADAFFAGTGAATVERRVASVACGLSLSALSFASTTSNVFLRRSENLPLTKPATEPTPLPIDCATAATREVDEDEAEAGAILSSLVSGAEIDFERCLASESKSLCG